MGTFQAKDVRLTVNEREIQIHDHRRFTPAEIWPLKLTLALAADTSAFDAAMAAIKALCQLPLERLPKAFLDVVDLLLSGPDAIQELFCLKVDDTTTATAGHLLVRLYPSDLLVGALAAAGAWDGERGAIKAEFRHGFTPSGDGADVDGCSGALPASVPEA